MQTQGVAIPQTASAVVQALFAMMLGVFVLGFVGFSQIDAIHNAAHDTRHSSAFPCH
ncbi:MAG: CbtB domain-containing protein [Alsobacter sp.]